MIFRTCVAFNIGTGLSTKALTSLFSKVCFQSLYFPLENVISGYWKVISYEYSWDELVSGWRMFDSKNVSQVTVTWLHSSGGRELVNGIFLLLLLAFVDLSCNGITFQREQFKGICSVITRRDCTVRLTTCRDWMKE